MGGKKDSIIKASLFEKKVAVEKLVEQSRLTSESLFLLVSSTIIVTLGLILNNPAVVIGGMLLAPLFSPLLIIGLGIVLSNKEIVVDNLKVFLKMFTSILLAALIISFLFNVKRATSEILLRAVYNFEYFLVAFVAGVAGTYFWVKPHLQNIISGIIIAVALIPPIASLGIGVSILNRDVISGSLMFFIINCIGIVFGSVLIFSLFGFGKSERAVEEAVEEKTKEIEEEKSSE